MELENIVRTLETCETRRCQNKEFVEWYHTYVFLTLPWKEYMKRSFGLSSRSQLDILWLPMTPWNVKYTCVSSKKFFTYFSLGSLEYHLWNFPRFVAHYITQVGIFTRLSARWPTDTSKGMLSKLGEWVEFTPTVSWKKRRLLVEVWIITRWHAQRRRPGHLEGEEVAPPDLTEVPSPQALEVEVLET